MNHEEPGYNKNLKDDMGQELKVLATSSKTDPINKTPLKRPCKKCKKKKQRQCISHSENL